MWCNDYVRGIVIGSKHGNPSSKSGQGRLNFHVELIPLGKVTIQLFFFQLGVNWTPDGAL